MGAKELSQYIHIRIKELGISKTKVIERAHISRNGFYKILDERTTDEIKLSTLIRNIPAWENRRLVCQDEDLIVTKKSGETAVPLSSTLANLIPLEKEIPIPTTPPNATVQLAVQFRAPDCPCTTISYWKMVIEET